MKPSQLMSAIESLTNNRKTYIVAIIAAVLAFLEAAEVYTVPAWAWPLLGAAGLGSLRLGVSKLKNDFDELVKKRK